MKRTIDRLCELARQGEKLTMLTAYDYETARRIGEAGIDMILVGDSLGMVVLGYDDTLSVTVEDMVRHTAAVARAKPESLVVADLPHRSYEDPEQGLENARRLMREAGADAVKLEGCKPDVVTAIVADGIPVMGHIGLTPQTVAFKVQGRDEASARRLQEEARQLQQAGCFALVLECVPRALAGEITASLRMPTIGIGAGPDCSGQVLVVHDVLGLFERFTPRFVKRYAEMGAEMSRAFVQYRDDVKSGRFPDTEHSFK